MVDSEFGVVALAWKPERLGMTIAHLATITAVGLLLLVLGHPQQTKANVLIYFFKMGESEKKAEKPAIKDNPSERKTITTESGLQYVDLVVGSGPQPRPGDSVVVHYTGWLTNWKKFDSSHDRNQPYEFVLGQGTVIKGWDEGVGFMRVGGKRKLTIPPSLAYGDRGYLGVIPPKSTLVFEVEFLKIKKPENPEVDSKVPDLP